MRISPQNVATNLSLAAIYWLTARLSLDLASLQGNVSPFWPPSGIATAAILLGGRRLWWGVFLGGLIANVLSPAPVITAAGIAAGNTLEAILAAGLVQRITTRAGLEPFAGLIGWIVASLVAPLVSAIPGVAILWMSGMTNDASLSALTLTWWVGDSIGMFVAAPALVTLKDAFHWRPTRGDLLRGGFLFCAGMSVCTWIFFGPRGSHFLFALFPLLLLATIWFGGNGAKLTCLGVVVYCVVAIGLAQPIFKGGSINAIHLQHEALYYSLGLTAQILTVFHVQRCLFSPGLVLLGSWILSGWIFATLESNRHDMEAFRFADGAQEASAAIRQRMTTYVDALYGGVSLFAASEKVTRDEWRRYVDSLHLDDRYPGINGIGYISIVRPDELDSFLAEVRADGFPDFAIRDVPNVAKPPVDPAGDARYIITYIEPISINREAVGLDVSSETNRQDAAQSARDYGVPRITDRIILVQDGRHRPGFLLYVPIYRNDAPHDTVHARRMNFKGWIYAPFIAENFFRGVLGNRADSLELTVFEGTTPSSESYIFGPKKTEASSFKLTSVIHLNGRMFTCGWDPGPDFPLAGNESLFNAITLALVPILLAGVVMTLQTSERHANDVANTRTRELRAVNEHLEIQIAERERAEQEAGQAREAAEAANAAKSEFLATMSHEIRTPMNGVIGYAELLAESPLSNEQKEWAQTIQNSGVALLTIINDILDFSKIEAGQLTLESIPFNPDECSRDVLDILRWQADKKSLRLAVDCEDKVPTRLIGDPTRFRQILLNLASNAVKFTEQGSVTVSLRWSRFGRLLVRVKDTGMGIPEDKLNRLFRRFSQVDSTTTRRFGGTGLGLAICRRLVLLMSGRIGVRSEPGSGTIFWFVAPFEEAAADLESARPDEACDQEFNEGTRILVAEDVVTNQKLAVALLSRLGCEVEIATNGREAVRKAYLKSYDMIYMDCQMPELDGYAATREIRSAGNPVPIIALTASALDGEREKCLDAGMNDLLTKPFVRDDFVRSLRRWKDRSALSDVEVS